jgi:peptide/nickel transport system permease protein
MLPRVSGNLARVAGVILLAIVVGIAIVGALGWAGDPNALDIEHGLSALGAPLAPTARHWLGTDDLGRDVWARLCAGAGTSLAVAALATLAQLAVGAGVGVAAGAIGGRTDTALMRAVDLVLAFPALLLAILLAALLRQTALDGTTAPVVIALVAVGWTTTARVVRTQASAIARSDAITAARALGASPVRIATRHVLPGCAGVAITLAALGFAGNLLAEAALSYLGLGPPPPAAVWGRMLFEGRAYYRTAPWLIVAPGVAILVAVIGFNLIGEALQARFGGERR